MESLLPRPHREASDIFNTLFKRLLDPASFDKASGIFYKIGWRNERLIATQIYLAHKYGRLEVVFSAYHKLMDPGHSESIVRPTFSREMAVVAVMALGIDIFELIADGDLPKLVSNDSLDIPEEIERMSKTKPEPHTIADLN